MCIPFFTRAGPVAHSKVLDNKRKRERTRRFVWSWDDRDGCVYCHRAGGGSKYLFEAPETTQRARERETETTRKEIFGYLVLVVLLSHRKTTRTEKQPSSRSVVNKNLPTNQPKSIGGAKTTKKGETTTGNNKKVNEREREQSVLIKTSQCTCKAWISADRSSTTPEPTDDSGTGSVPPPPFLDNINNRQRRRLGRRHKRQGDLDARLPSDTKVMSREEGPIQ